ncbi:MAG TPA: ABC transporter permease [Candidatus Dormibacteraeota bacterium]|jgi:ABC-2 type transport system permease protein|nr:ABC transporter permease [Candidatus Dormibacteraeota bacterium]
MTRLLLLEIKRSLLDPRYLVLAVVMPVGFYLLFSELFGAHGQRVEGLPQPLELMVSMAAYGGIWAVFSGTAPRIAQERGTGWLRQLRLTPLPGGSVMVAKVVASMVAALPAMILVCVTAVVAHGVSLDARTWAELLGALWLGTLPLALLGFAIGFLVGSEVAYGAVMVLYFGFGAVGGLWMPLSALPAAMQDIGKVLPSHGLGDVGWKIAAGQVPDTSSLVVLAVWGVACAIVALVAYRVQSARR